MDACCDDVETISTCSGGSDQDSPWPWMPWPDTDDECCYPKSDYRPPRECLETACLAMLLTTQKKPRSAELPEEDTKSTLEPGKALKLPICKGRFSVEFFVQICEIFGDL